MAGVGDRAAPEPRPSARHNCGDALLDRAEVGAQIGASEAAFWGVCAGWVFSGWAPIS